MRRVPGVLLIVGLVLAACSPAAPRPTPPFGVAPTRAVAPPGPVSIPTTRPTAALQYGVYTDPAGTFTVRLPDGWQVRDASTPDAAQVELVPPAGTPVGAVIIVRRLADLGGSFDTATETLLRQLTSQGQASEEARESRAGQLDVTFHIVNGPADSRVRARFVEAGPLFGTVWLTAPGDLYAGVEPAFQAILDSFRVEASASLP